MEPAHFSSSLFLAIALSACIVSWRPATILETSWQTLVVGSVLVVLLEILQLVNEQRSFELNDILFGVAGVSAGAMGSYGLMRLLGKVVYTPVVIALCFFASTSVIYFYGKTNLIHALSCELQQAKKLNWASVLITDFNKNTATVASEEIGFCIAQNDIVAKNDVVYTAPLRLTLSGLADAVREQQSFAIALQFTSTSSQSFSEIASITWQGTANSYFARINRSGKHLFAMLQFNGGERSSTSLANGLKQGQQQELVIQYDGKNQTTWLNGVVAGTETGVLNPPKGKNAELVLNIAQTSDRKWWVPFEGEITGIYLGTTVLEFEDINGLFAD